MESSVIAKVFHLLELLAASDRPQSLAELSQQINAPKPTVHRQLKLLTDLGYVERGDDAVYGITDKLRRLGIQGQQRYLVAATEGPVTRLHKRTGETVNLGVLKHDRVVYLKVLESTHPLRRIAKPDSTDPFHCTALGRAIVSHLDTARRGFLLKHNSLERRTRRTVIDARKLSRILQEASGRGYAIERDQTDVGVTCIAAPILEDDTPVAAISISVPTARLDARREKELIAAVRSAARASGAALRRCREKRI